MEVIRIPNIANYTQEEIDGVLILTPKRIYITEDEITSTNVTNSTIMDCVVMNNGKILQFDTPENIYNNPSSSFVARFFGETLSIKSKVNNKKAKTIFGPINITNSKNGKEIEIVFRSEAFNITKNKSKNRTKKIKSRIIAVRYISDNSYLHLDILNNSFKKHIHIKVPGKFIPPKNKICYINIGKKNFFVF